jgi:hypothetical protein
MLLVTLPSPLEATACIQVCPMYSTHQACTTAVSRMLPNGNVKYSFTAECILAASRKQRVVQQGHSICNGVMDTRLVSLYGSPPYGTPTVQQIRALLEHNAIRNSGFEVLHMMLSGHSNDEIKKVIGDHHVTWYTGCFNSIRCTFCIGHTNIKDGLCVSCDMLGKDTTVRRRAQSKYAALRGHTDRTPTWTDVHSLRDEVLVHSELKLKLGMARESRHAHRTYMRALTDSKTRMQNRLTVLKDQMARLMQTERDIPEFLKQLQDAHRKGELADRKALMEVLQSVAISLKSGRRNRRLTPVMKSFYARLLIHGGPQIHDFVSSVLEGPHARTTRRFTKGPLTEYILGLKVEFVAAARHILGHWGISDAPILVGEDATALQPRLDTIQEGGKLYVMGYTGGRLEIKSKDDFKHVSQTQRLATSFYMFVVIPLVPGAPYIPLFVQLHDGTKNTFNSNTIQDTWHATWRMCRTVGLNMVGHVGDGAAPFRRSVYDIMFRHIPTGAHAIVVDHPFIQLCMPATFSDIDCCFTAGVVDYLHICWRIRVQLLSPNRCLMVLGLPASHSKILLHMRNPKSLDLHLKLSDLDPHDKQNWDGLRNLFDFIVDKRKGVVYEKSTVRDAFRTGGDYYGLWLFLTFAHTYTRIFIMKDRQVIQVLEDCGFCLAFLAYWRKGMDDIKVSTTIKDNFLTSETYQDIVLSLNAVVLLAKLFALRFPNMKFDPSRFSSRYVEYMFQYLRIQGAGHNVKLSALSAMNKLRAFHALLDLEGSNEVLPEMKSKRGMPKGKDRVQSDWNQAGLGYYPDETGFVAAIDKGVNNMQDLLRAPIDNGCVIYRIWDNLHDPGNMQKVAESLLDKQRRGAEEQWASIFTAYHDRNGGGMNRVVDGRGGDDGGEDDVCEDDHDLMSPPDLDEGMGCLNMPRLDEEEGGEEEGGEQDADDDLLGVGLSPQLDALRARDRIRESYSTKQDLMHDKCRDTMEAIISKMDENDNAIAQTEGTPFDKLVVVCRVECNMFNANIGRQGTDRVAGRFKPCELRDISDVAYQSNEYYTDDDFVAVIFDIDNQVWDRNGRSRTERVPTVFYGVIEKMVYEAPGKRKENIFLLHCDDKNGVLRIRFLNPLKNTKKEHRRELVRGRGKGKGGLLFELPLVAEDGVNDRVTVEHIISVVDIQLDKKERVYVLNPEDELVVNNFLIRWKAATSDVERAGIMHGRQKKRPTK